MDRAPEASPASELRQYAWQYFQAHGQARLTTFRFYIAFCTVLATAGAAILSQGRGSGYGGVLGAMLAFLSFIYWQVDRRHKQLIGNAQAALIQAEKGFDLPPDHPARLFTVDASQKAIDRRAWLNLTYSKSVNLVFLVFGIVGVALAVLAAAACCRSVP